MNDHGEDGKVGTLMLLWRAPEQSTWASASQATTLGLNLQIGLLPSENIHHLMRAGACQVKVALSESTLVVWVGIINMASQLKRKYMGFTPCEWLQAVSYRGMSMKNFRNGSVGIRWRAENFPRMEIFTMVVGY